MTENITKESVIEMQIFDTIELAIKSSLKEYSDEAIKNKYVKNSEWSYKLKEALGRLGHNFNFKVCSSGFTGTFDREWLFDMVWYKTEGEGEASRLIEIPFVAEFEWNPSFDEIKHDFEKLLLANVTHRLMICYVYKDFHEKTFEYFEDAIKKYFHLNKGDRFMIALMDYKKYSFEYRVFIK